MLGLRFAFFLLWAAGALAAQDQAALDAARRLDAAGLWHLALTRVEQSQPQTAAAPGWAEWEVLRLKLLSRGGRHQEALKRVAGLPVDMPGPLRREALAVAARAAILSGEGALARRHALRILWQQDAGAGEIRAARLLVIESLVGDRTGDAAYGSMLRFQQDYRPLDPGVADFFAESLLGLGMAQEAVHWIGSLGEASPGRLLLRFKSGLLAADAAAAQARAQLAKRASRDSARGYWRVIEQAALQLRDDVLHVEALENLLHLVDAANVRQLAGHARALWQAYHEAAREAGNRHHLLAGDDAGWTDFAARRLGSSAPQARAVFAYLAQHGQTPEARHNAQLQLVFSLESDKTELAALRLFQYAPAGMALPDVQTRYLLGAIAESHGIPALAVGFWQDLEAPPGMRADEWRVRAAAVALRAGIAERTAASVRDIAGTVRTLPAAAVAQCAALAQDMLDAGNPGVAAELFEALLPAAEPALQRRALFGLGRSHEMRNQPETAADYYLRASLMPERRMPDALALQARQHAALNLARAGKKEDARLQFEWLLKHSKDAAQLEFVRHEMKKL